MIILKTLLINTYNLIIRVDINHMTAELYVKETGCCKGHGGSVHVADAGVGILGANGIAGGEISIGSQLKHLFLLV